MLLKLRNLLSDLIWKLGRPFRVWRARRAMRRFSQLMMNGPTEEQALAIGQAAAAAQSIINRMEYMRDNFLPDPRKYTKDHPDFKEPELVLYQKIDDDYSVYQLTTADDLKNVGAIFENCMASGVFYPIDTIYIVKDKHGEYKACIEIRNGQLMQEKEIKNRQVHDHCKLALRKFYERNKIETNPTKPLEIPARFFNMTAEDYNLPEAQDAVNEEPVENPRPEPLYQVGEYIYRYSRQDVYEIVRREFIDNNWWYAIYQNGEDEDWIENELNAEFRRRV